MMEKVEQQRLPRRGGNSETAKFCTSSRIDQAGGIDESRDFVQTLCYDVVLFSITLLHIFETLCSSDIESFSRFEIL